jgi:flagellar basal-body rod protein FlgB
MVGKMDAEFGFLRNALNLRAYRQELLASNVANSDTPNYKARDVDFAAALRQAQGPARGPLGMELTKPGHLQSKSGSGPLGAQAMYRAAVQPSIDGNTVDMDVERGQFTDNALHYQFLIDRLNGQAKTLMTAIQGQ